jgi:hypothetical protein
MYVHISSVGSHQPAALANAATGSPLAASAPQKQLPKPYTPAAAGRPARGDEPSGGAVIKQGRNRPERRGPK